MKSNKDIINNEVSAVRKLRYVSKLLMFIPFVRCIILNGSLSMGTFKKSSDIDILIIAKDKRIFTCRFLVVGILALFGLKRSSDESKPHAGKFCVNYFLTESFLTIPTGRGEKIDRYCAINYSASVFVAGDRKLFDRFMQRNEELFCLSASSLPEKSKDIVDRLKVKYCSNISIIQNIFEWFLIGSFGNSIEKKLKDIQIRKIELNPQVKKYPDLIAYNDKELRFHPPSEANPKF